MPDCGKQSGFFVPWRISWYNGGMSETLEGRKTGGTDGEVSAAGGRGGKGGTRGGNRGGCREDKARQLRLMKLLEQVQRGGYPNATDLRNKFEVSRSTIMRDIDFLKDQYLVPIEYCSEMGGYCISDPNYTIPSFLLTEGELFSLHIILPLMEEYENTPLEPVFQSIMRRMMDMLPGEVQVQSSFNRDQVAFIKNPQPEIRQEVFYGVMEAIKSGCTLEFGYRSIKRQDYITRQFDPYQMMCQRGDWYVIGHCHRHRDIRVYNLARMSQLKVTDATFRKESDFDLHKYIDPDFGVWTQRERFVVELLFSADVNTYILERQWHVNQECRQLEDGSVWLKFETNQFDESLHWVMSFGSKVQVLHPPALREAVRQEVERMIRLY